MKNKWIPKRFIKYAVIFLIADWCSAAILTIIFGNYEILLWQKVIGLAIK